MRLRAKHRWSELYCGAPYTVHHDGFTRPFWSISSQKRVCVQREKHIKIHKQHTSLFNLISSPHSVMLTKNPTVIHRYQNRKEGESPPWIQPLRPLQCIPRCCICKDICDGTWGSYRFKSHPCITIVYFCPQHSGNTEYTECYSAYHILG